MPNKKTLFQRARELLTRSSSTEENTTSPSTPQEDPHLTAQEISRLAYQRNGMEWMRRAAEYGRMNNGEYTMTYTTSNYPREENRRLYYGYDFAEANQRAAEILRSEQLQINQRNRILQEIMRTPPQAQRRTPQPPVEEEVIGDDDNTSLTTNGTTNFIECPHCANEFVIDNNGEVEVMCTACGEDIDVFGIGKDQKKRNRVDHQVVGNRQPNRGTDEGGYGFYIGSAQQADELRGRRLDRIIIDELYPF